MEPGTASAGLDREDAAPLAAGRILKGRGRRSDLSRRVAAFAFARPATVLAGLAAAAPVILAAAGALEDGWQPVADRANVATRAYDVFSTHMPLTGPNSFTTELTGHATFSLGPMLFWLLAPAAHIGAPQSFVVTMAILNSACILLAVALARRRGGIWLMIASAAAIAVMSRSLTAADFYDIWNPAAPLMPLLALAFVCWSLACGEHRFAPLAVLLASFCAQCHNGFLFPCAALLLVAALGLFISRRSRFAVAARGRALPWLAAAAALLALCWTPPIADQLAGKGNIGHVLEAGSTPRARQGNGVGVRALARTIGITPWWLTTVRSPWSRKYEVHDPLTTARAVSSALLLAWLAAAIAIGLRRRRLDIAAGAAAAIALSLTVGLVAAITPTGRILGGTLAYTLWSASIAGMFVWLIAGWSAAVLAAEALRPLRGARLRGATRLARRVAALLAAAGLTVAAVYGTRDQRRDEHLYEFSAVKRLNAGLAAVPRGSVVYLTTRLDDVVTPLRPELTFALRRRGVRALGTGAWRLGGWYELHSRRYDHHLLLWHIPSPAKPAGHVIATARLLFDGRMHTVGLSLLPGGKGKPRQR